MTKEYVEDCVLPVPFRLFFYGFTPVFIGAVLYGYEPRALPWGIAAGIANVYCGLLFGLWRGWYASRTQATWYQHLSAFVTVALLVTFFLLHQRPDRRTLLEEYRAIQQDKSTHERQEKGASPCPP